MSLLELFSIPTVISSLIAIIGVYVSFRTAKSQIKLKSKSIENEVLKIETELESLKQSQISKILDKRIEVYPILYKTLLTFHRHWLYERKPINGVWSKNFINEINKFNEDHGVFLSQPAYNSFNELRGLLIEMDFKLSRGKIASEDEMGKLDDIILGKENYPGIGAFLKDDLGSYSIAAIQKNKKTNN